VYEEQYRKPPADKEEQADAAGEGAPEVAEDGSATGKDAAGGEAESAPAPEEGQPPEELAVAGDHAPEAEPPEAETAADTGEPGEQEK